MAEVRAVADIIPPQGGRIHIVRVPVNPARGWQEAIDAAGPNTPQNYNVRKVGDHYPPKQGKEAEREVILVNFGRYIDGTQVAVNWGKTQKLRPDDPRSTFAVAEHKPRLHRELNLDSMAIVSPEECSFGGVRRVCRVWLDDAGRDCNLRWCDDGWFGGYWFAFLREDKPSVD